MGAAMLVCAVQRIGSVGFTTREFIHFSRNTPNASQQGLAQNAASASRSGTSGGISSGQGLLRQLSLERHLQRPRHRHLEQPETLFGSTCRWPI
ncbi:hypothetical protein DPX16_2918 [Anabarilius grahami]|uniref:Uncharacterized protein n=1 Tax=Anabarilius grahami TaxID=495550 RepID=A0A3N0Y5C8_ANAGA|nr:hypothetical protein DPX16_2918 [Anabarilius grahami]